MENKIKTYGFDGKDIHIDPTHYIFGSSSLPQTILQPDGNWLPFIPKFEAQSTPNFDTDGCTVFGTLNALEVLMKRIFGGDEDYAERFNYILAEVRPPGGDPHKVAETIRSKGVINQALLPITETFEQYIAPDPMTNDLLLEGTGWLQTKKFGHEWVFTNNPTDKAARVLLLKQALQYSPVAISVTAWYRDDNGMYIDNGQPNCHWVACVGLELQPDGEYCPLIIDSYEDVGGENYIKKLHPDHHIEYAKRYSVETVTPQVTPEKKTTWLGILQSILKSLLGIEKQVQALPKSPAPASVEPVVTAPVPKPVITSKYLWDTVDNARHSARVIGDEEEVSVFGKDVVCAVIMGESSFSNSAVNQNKDDSGHVLSTDWGICQINDYYHIGPDKDFPSVDYVTGNPDAAVRYMYRMYKAGKISMWVAYSSGLYRKYM